MDIVAASAGAVPHDGGAIFTIVVGTLLAVVGPGLVTDYRGMVRTAAGPRDESRRLLFGRIVGVVFILAEPFWLYEAIGRFVRGGY